MRPLKWHGMAWHGHWGYLAKKKKKNETLAEQACHSSAMVIVVCGGSLWLDPICMSAIFDMFAHIMSLAGVQTYYCSGASEQTGVAAPG